MPAPPKLLKAELREIEWNDQQVASEVNADKNVKVQFNPETLTVNFTNQRAGGDQRGGSATQFVGAGTTKLTLDLWFDVTVPYDDDQGGTYDDVRKLTEKVNHFIKPQQQGSGSNVKWIAPGVRFLWGTFVFDGILESMNEKLEYFSEDGKPLRAMVSLSLSSQTIQFQFGEARKNAASATGTGAAAPGTRPQQPARSGDSVQSIASRQGQPDRWRDIAAANNIENPRRLTPGDLIDVNVSIR